MHASPSDAPAGEDPPEEAEPIWRPSAGRRARTRIIDFAREARAFGAPDVVGPEGFLDYRGLHRWSVEELGPFWAAVWRFCGVVGYAGPDGSEGSDGSEGPRDRTLAGELGTDAAMWQPDAREALSSTEAASRMEPPIDSGLRWFPRVRLNYAENLLRGPDDRVAVVAWDEEGPTTTLTLGELRGLVARFATALRAVEIRPGDRVAGFLPNVPETVIAMLGAASVGAVWTSCSPDFGTEAVVDRFGQTEPRLLVAGTSHRYAGRVHDTRARVAELAERIPSLERVVLVPGPPGGAGPRGQPRGPGRGGDAPAERGLETPSDGGPGAVAWDDFLPAAATPEYRRLPFDHPLAILYSSGTTGLPKCIVHGAGGTLLQHMKEHALHVDVGPGDRLFYFTTCGWMMWNWLVTGLASGATIVLYDGAPHAPPDVLWRMAEGERVTVFGTSARYLHFLEQEGVRPGDAYDLSALRTVLSTGSPLAPHAFDHVYDHVSSDVHLASISGGTDLVSCFVLGVPTEPLVRGRIQAAGLGMAVEIWSPEGRRIVGEPGELVCTRPFPSMPLRFWNDPGGQRYRSTYFDHFPGVWRHGDWAEEGLDGTFLIHGRSDATLNPGGVRIGTSEIYRHLEPFEEIVDVVAVGLRTGPDREEDERIALFVRLRPGHELDDGLRDRIRERLRTAASPRHVPHRIEQVDDVPRTVSGKTSEVAVRDALHGREVANRSALANPEALEGFRRFTVDSGPTPPSPGPRTTS